MNTNLVKSEGAELVYDVQGEGEPMILIPGAGGDAFGYRKLAPILAQRFTVITYDRRCRARSSGDDTAPLDMRQQARDVVAVLHGAGFERGFIFGNSGGANIGLQVTTDAPESVTRLIAHEPPVVSLLPDSEEQFAFMHDVYRIFQEQGSQPALKKFAESLVGVEGFAVPRPEPAGKDEFAFFFAKEYLHIAEFVPDLSKIVENQVRTEILVGAQSLDAYYVRSARIIAERLQSPVHVVPGNHLASSQQPGPFADAICRALEND